jgi:hypothetical protein
MIAAGENVIPDTVGGVGAACPIAVKERARKMAAQLRIANRRKAETMWARLHDIDFSRVLRI